MSASERRAAARIVLLSAALALALPVGGASKVTQSDCAAGVCGFNIAARDMDEAPCKGLPVLVVYSESTGATLIQCGAPHGIDGTMSYLFDRGLTGRDGLELAGTRFVKPDSLADLAENGVPDRFGPVPLCVTPAAAAAGEFVLLAKMPAPDPNGGYCYRVIHVGTENGALALRSDPGAAPAVAATAHRKWRKLAEKMLRHIRSGAPH
ncbi:MAG TPA: hypothetical protein VFS02_11150 [Telluria sp.]|nr:hypothetical protein [Telluria sp.]